MGERFLVHEQRTGGGAATHAIVIGVGDYPHLPGGKSKQKTEDHEGMTQLTSPPISAREFASWLIDSFEHPDKPLASVSLLLSERRPKPFFNSRTKQTTSKVALANSANVFKALREWKARGDPSPKNLMMFFFCGHGLAAGKSMSLPLADYGADELPGLEGALDFDRFTLGMGTKCWAREQCFFVDACRTASEILKYSEGAAGRVPIAPGPPNAEWTALSAPVFFSTTAGFKAYARPNEPSIYTRALLESLQDLGAERYTDRNAKGHNDDWRVNTHRLNQAVGKLIARRWLDRLASPTGDNISNITLNRVEEPRALVYVRTDPPTALPKVSIECRRKGLLVEPTWVDDPNQAERILKLPHGIYDFTAIFPAGRATIPQKDHIIQPIDSTLHFTEPPP